MIKQIVSALTRSLNIIFAVIGLASISPDVTVDNIVVENKNNVVFVVFDTESMLNESIMQIVDSGVAVDFTYFVITRKNGKLVFSRDYIDHVYLKNGLYHVNSISVDSKDKLKNLVNHHRFIILDGYEDGSESRNSNKDRYITIIRIGLSSPETPEIVKLWGNKPRIELEFR